MKEIQQWVNKMYRRNCKDTAILTDYTFCECHLYVNTNGSALRNPDVQVVTETYATVVPTRNVLHLVSLWYCGRGTFVGVTSGSAFVLIVI